MQNNKKKLVINVAWVLAFSIVGATLTMGFDLGGTRWLKFVLYMIFFASLSSSGLLSSRISCNLSRFWKRN